MQKQQTKRPSRALIGAAIAAVVGATVIACGGGGGGSSVATPTPTPTPTPVNGPAWLSYGGDAQHSAQSAIQTQDLNKIVWQTPVDTAPQYSTQGYLLVHYGSPVITSKNTVLVPVKRAAANVFRVEGRVGANGSLVWSADSDYAVPAHRWTPAYNVTLTKSNRVYFAGAGGKVYYRDDADSASASTQTAVFYGAAAYTAGKSTLDATVFLNTPITADSAGNIFFGFVVQGANPANLTSGIARIGADGTGSWVTASAAAGDAAMIRPAMGAAPAISSDEKTLYVVVKDDVSTGQLLALDTTTLKLKTKTALIDPSSGVAANVNEDGTASPTVGPDGDVYMGVLESTYAAHNARGWLLHFDATLATKKTPGSFGWDDTASIVPAALVPSYTGSSSYLVMTKYNNYGRAGTGDAKNKVAVLDPNATQPDAYSSKSVMREVLTILGPTPDPNYAGGVTEWCINTAAVDPFTKSILVNSEDGYLYRWDLTTNKLSQKIKLTSGMGESYTPTAVGADGQVYAINNAILFAVGK